MSTGYLTLLKEYVISHMSYGFGKLSEDRQAFINSIAVEDSAAGTAVRDFFGGVLTAVSLKELKEADAKYDAGIRELAKKKMKPEPEYQIALWNLGEAEAYAVRMAYAFFVFEDMEYIASVFSDDRNARYLTPGLLALCCGEDADPLHWYKILGHGSVLAVFILDTYSLEKEDGEQTNSDPAAFSRRRIALNRRMEAVMMGDHRWASSYAGVLKPVFPKDTSEEWIGKFDDALLKWMNERTDDEKASAGVLCVYGKEGSGRKTLIRHTAKRLELALGFADIEKLEEISVGVAPEERRRLLTGLVREMILYSLVPVMVTDCRDKERAEEVMKLTAEMVELALRFFPMVLIVSGDRRIFDLDGGVAFLERPELTLLESRDFWEKKSKAYKLADKDIPGLMANRFTLTPGKIAKSLEMSELQTLMDGRKKITLDTLTEACYQVLEQRMGDKAVYIPPNYTMEDLILPPRQKKKLQDICDLVRYKSKVLEEWGIDEKMPYGRGISAAFIGAPGTGKTMAAQVLSAELGLRLYKVNLSGVVSKYVGETEKRLNEIFDEAEKSQVILFFDEADVLFGKRSEVKDSNDKYSNMEVAFLLQKMENYNGITIIATNLFQHFDEAFKRRLKSVVEFSLPDEATRKTLWQSMIPDKLPTEEVDFDYLASHFELSGSNIRNIIFQAAFYAAAKDKAMGMEEIIPAVANEYSKLGKTISREDVDEYYMYLEG